MFSDIIRGYILIALCTEVLGKDKTHLYFAVAIRAVSSDNITAICTGSIITSTWVLTAGHCVNQDMNVTEIIFGSVRYDLAEPQHTTYPKRVIVHPDYNWKKLKIGFGTYRFNDIGLIETTTRMEADIHPVVLQGVNAEFEQCKLVGYNLDGLGIPSELDEAPVTLPVKCWFVVHPEAVPVCRRYHVCSVPRININDDAGGILLCQANNEDIQVGVLSDGTPNPKSPEHRLLVFTAMYFFVDWVIFVIPEAMLSAATTATQWCTIWVLLFFGHFVANIIYFMEIPISEMSLN